MKFSDGLWRKSSFSSETADCVEIAYPDWRTSSYTADMSECVEIAYCTDFPTVGIRDSKNPTGGHLTLPATALHLLTAAVTRG